MFQLVGSVFSSFGKSWFGHQLDTFVDKLCRNLTVFLFIAFAVLVSAQQYVGNPIHCRHQSVHDGNFEKYMDEVCWVTNTYYVPQGEVLKGDKLSEYRRINYYQWVPLVLLVQALMFYLPHIFLQGMLRKSGLDLGSIVSTGVQVHTCSSTEEREKKLGLMAGQLGSYLTHYQNTGSSSAFGQCWGKVKGVFSKCLCGKRSGSYIAVVFLGTKILYVANAIGQFFLLNSFLSSNLHYYGWSVFTSILTGEDWPQSEIFPKSTICRFELHAFASEIHEHYVQCVLPVNFFHEKLYIIIWFWLVIVATATCCSFLFWVYRFLFRVDRIRFVNHHLRALSKVIRGKENESSHFILDFLKQDGVLVLRLVNLNVSGIVCAQFAGALWDHYRSERATRGFNRRDEDTEDIDLQDETFRKV